MTKEHVSSETEKEIEEASEIENLKKVEAVLFVAGKFLNLQELVSLTDINPLLLRELIEKLTEKYNKDDSAIEIVNKSDMWKMDVKQEYVNFINKLATGNTEFSKAEQETLAVIAYKQPVKQSIIVKIRGNKSYDHIKKFIDVGLVVGKQAGHTKELKLSDDFFDYFHLTEKGIETASSESADSENSQNSGEKESEDNSVINSNNN